MKNFQTPISRARGRGAAGEGVGHWVVQRLTAIALVPLTLWFAFGIAALSQRDHADVIGWMASPINAGLLVLFMLTLFWHSMLGVQVVVEDYVEPAWAKITVLIANKLIHFGLGGIVVVAVLRIAFAGT